jgi:hypothetical protein
MASEAAPASRELVVPIDSSDVYLSRADVTTTFKHQIADTPIEFV